MPTTQEKRGSGQVLVTCGANSADVPGLAGNPVKEAEKILRESLTIPPNAATLVAGEKVGSNHVLKAGDVLEFLMPAGSKG